MLTLLEASKRVSGDVVRSGVIDMFAQSNDLLRVMGFIDVPGGAYQYKQRGTLPGVAFRGINESFQESTGVVNPLVEALRIAGGDLDVDNALIKFHGEGIREDEEAAKIQALGLYIAKTMINGDSLADARVFDGLRNRITGSQLIAAGSTDGGDALSLAKLDEAIDMVEGPTHLLMSKALRRRLTAAARDADVGGYITYDVDEFGRRVAFYNDLPILIADFDETGAQILGFNEVGPGGSTATAASMYVLSIGPNKLVGLQNGIMDARDLGELQEKPVRRTRVDWYVGMAALHGRCAARIWGIKDVAMTA